MLDETDVRLVVVGGVAAIAHEATRSPRVLDVVVEWAEENLRRRLDALAPHDARHFTRPDLGPIPQSARELTAYCILLLTTGLGRLDVLRSVPPADEHDELATVEMELVPGRRFRAIALDDLIRVEEAVGRSHDEAVEAELRRIRELRREGP